MSGIVSFVNHTGYHSALDLHVGGSEHLPGENTSSLPAMSGSRHAWVTEGKEDGAMRSKRFTKLTVLFLIGLACAISPQARATPVPAAPVTGWVWISEDGYWYSLNYSTWYYSSNEGTTWLYNYGTGSWFPDSLFPTGWVWMQEWRNIYCAPLAAWLYVLPPPGGIWVFSFNAQQWIQMP